MDVIKWCNLLEIYQTYPGSLSVETALFALLIKNN